MGSKDQSLIHVADDDPLDFNLTVDDQSSEIGPDGKEIPFVYDEEAPNLIPEFEAHSKGRAALKKIVTQVVEDFDSAWESTEKRRKKNADNWKLFTGDLPKKVWPFEDCANAHVPLMFKTITRLVFRAFDEIFGEWGGFYKVLPVGPGDDAIAEILTKHGNWQLREVVPDFYRQQMRALLLFFAQGDVVSHSYWDEVNNRPCHEILTGDDFVVPYVHVTTCPDYSDVPFRVKIMQKYKHELSAMRKLWSNVDKVINKEHSSLDGEPDMLWSESVARSMGIDKPDDQRAAPYKLLWYEGWTEELPNQDEPRFIRAIVDYSSHQIMCLTIHEEAQWQEKRRFEMQQQELDAYKSQLSDYHSQIQQIRDQRAQMQAQLQQAQMQGQQIDPIAVHQAFDQLDESAINPVPPPAWMQDPTQVDETGMPIEGPRKPKRVPVHTFTHGVCIEPVVGNIGLGFGGMEADYNRAANTLFSQFSDQGTLGNTWGLITAGNVEFSRPLSFGPGKVNVAKGISGDQLKGAIHELRPQPANPQLAEMIDKIDQYAEQAAQAPGVMSGEPGKSGETYRGISARLEQATKMLSVPTRIYIETFLKQILKNNGMLNSLFLNDEEIISVNNEMMGQVEELKLGRKLYERDYRVQIIADARFAARLQRIAESDEVLQMFGNIPPLQQNIPLLQYALRKSFEARGKYDYSQYLGPQVPPQAVQTPLGMPPLQPPGPPGIPQPGGPLPQGAQPNGAPPPRPQQPMQGPPPQ
jgi:hypothetical protein